MYVSFTNIFSWVSSVRRGQNAPLPDRLSPLSDAGTKTEDTSRPPPQSSFSLRPTSWASTQIVQWHPTPTQYKNVQEIWPRGFDRPNHPRYPDGTKQSSRPVRFQVSPLPLTPHNRTDGASTCRDGTPRRMFTRGRGFTLSRSRPFRRFLPRPRR